MFLFFAKKDNTFGEFSNYTCGMQDVILSSDQTNCAGQHKTTISRSMKYDVYNAGLVRFNRPVLGWVIFEICYCCFNSFVYEMQI